MRKKNVKILNIVIGLILILAVIFPNINYAETETNANEKQIEAKESKQLEDGIYTISSKINKNMVIEIPNKSKEEAVKVQLANKAKVINKSQEVRVKNIGNGYYKLMFEHSSKVLDVPGASKGSGIQLQQYSSNNTMAQQWIIKETGDGYYYIISGCSGLYVDIPGGHAEENSKIQLYQGNGTNAQKFSFTKVEELKTDKIEDGTYYITSALAQNKVISIEEGKQNDFANAYIWENKKREYQKFDVIYNKKADAYIITAVHSNKSLDVSYAGQSNGSNVAQYQTHKGDTEQWILNKTADGYYNIISKCNYLNLDVNGAKTANGTNIQMYEGNGTNAQKFKFIKADIVKGTQTIEDGVYNIVTKLNNNKLLQIENGATSNNAKARFANKLNVMNKNQAFEIKYLNNGYYQIKQQKSQKVLEVSNGSYQNGAQIVQNSENNSSTIQQWIIKDAGNGYFYIISKCNGLVIDVPGGNVEKNSVIQMYEENGTDAQKFKFVKVNQKLDNQEILADGVYKIRSALNNDRCIDISTGSYANETNVQIWTNDNVQQQKFQLTYNKKEGNYQIKSVNSGKVLDVQSNGKENGANVWQYEENNTEAQKWILQSAGDGFYYIVAVNSYLYLDVADGKTNNGTNIQIYDGNKTKAQKFKFEKVSMIDSDSYNIETKLNKNKVLDVSTGSTADGTNIQIWKFDGVNQQIFEIKNIDYEYCKIIAKHSNKALTVEKRNVIQKEYTESDEQKWKFEIAENGYYRLKSKASGLYLDVTDAKTNNGTNIQVHEKNTSNAQKFRVRKSITYEKGVYGESGLLKAGDSRGSKLEYYRYGDGPNVFFAIFTVHGFEDNWNHDGEALVKIANDFYNDLKRNHADDYELSKKWTIYILPEINPDGRRYGTTNNGPGRTTLYSEAPQNKGIDMNRSWKSSGFNANAKSRNYAGTAPYQAYEAKALREFLINHKSQNGQTVLVDLHGWLQQLIGNSEIAGYYGIQFPNSNTKSLERYGDGYLIGWARTALASNGRTAKTALIELPRAVYSNADVERQNIAQRYINATISMLQGVN